MSGGSTRAASAPQAAPLVSVVVLAYDSAAEVGGAVEALRAQRLDEPFEVIVVWSGDERAVDEVRRVMPEAVVVGHQERIPTGAGRNLGVATARGEIIAFLAADCRPAPDWLARRVEGHRQGFAAVGGAVVCPSSAGALARATHLIEFLDCSPGRPRAEVRGQPVYNLSFHRSVFERHGGYEDDLVCGEDTAFNRRLAAAGERVLFDPAVRMTHGGRQGLREFLRHQVRHGVWFGWLCRHRPAEVDPAGAFGSPLRLALWYPIVRMVRGARRIAVWERGSLAAALWLAPLMTLGLLASAAGAVRAYLRPGTEPPIR
ncbi:MAG: glycosyltransferase [Thermoanaerobaculales bacterium]|nr:glycosyltransferase [Thermoanaerobaculales bacterium]